jgi:hypothetical protein
MLENDTGMQAEQLGCAMHEVEEKEHKADLL